MGIAFFGGSFDPIHIGHILVARDVVELCNIEKIYFMPAFISPFKPPSIASPEQRLHMLKLALEDEPWAFIETIELERKEISYTYNSAILLEAKYDLTPTFIIGYDAYLSLEKWHKYKELLNIAKFIVVNRNIKEDFTNKNNIRFCPTKNIEISSTMIRRRLKEGKSVRYMIPDNVLEYIKKEGIYA